MKDLCGIKLYTIKEFIQMCGLGKNKVYELMNEHAIEYVDFHGTRRITEEQIRNAISKMIVKENNHKLYPKG